MEATTTMGVGPPGAGAGVGDGVAAVGVGASDSVGDGAGGVPVGPGVHSGHGPPTTTTRGFTAHGSMPTIPPRPTYSTHTLPRIPSKLVTHVWPTLPEVGFQQLESTRQRTDGVRTAKPYCEVPQGKALCSRLD